MAETPATGIDKLRKELYARIVSGEIENYSRLNELLEKSSINAPRELLSECFALIKRIYWGVFQVLTREKYPRLWNSLVIQDKKYPEFGDLKKYTMISEIYVAILDIHGYTSFCEETKKNITMLQRLDKFLVNEIGGIAASYGCIANRERGDEILLVGADASEILQATFEIIQVFSKSRKTKYRSAVSADFYLPEFRISAGVSGGQPTIPLIITERGALSGALINSAARLQGRANAMSPTGTKVIVEQYVKHNYQKNTQAVSPILEGVNFFYNGEITFKGITMKTFEMFTYAPEEQYKSRIESLLVDVQQAIKENQWQGKVFSLICDLGVWTARFLPPVNKTVQVDRRNINLSNESLAREFLEIKRDFDEKSDFSGAVERLGFLCRLTAQWQNFDPLVREYLDAAYKAYQKPVEYFKGLFDSFIEENSTSLFTMDERKIYEYYHRVDQAYTNLLRKAGQDVRFRDKRLMFWHKSIESVKQDIQFSIYSGKK